MKRKNSKAEYKREKWFDDSTSMVRKRTLHHKELRRVFTFVCHIHVIVGGGVLLFVMLLFSVEEWDQRERREFRREIKKR